MGWEDDMTFEQKVAYDEILLRVPGFMYERHRLLLQRLEPTGVLLPARVNKPFASNSSRIIEAMLFGLPITWSEKEEWGLLLHLPLPKEASNGPSNSYRQY